MANKKQGRPPIYKNADEMQTKIDEYFKKCKGEPLTNQDGEPILNKYSEPVIINSEAPTVAGLAAYLGFGSKQSLYDYQNKKEFSYSITRARLALEAYTESRLYDRDGARGAEFSLRCNFGWKDEKNTDIERIKENIQTLADILQKPIQDRELPEDE